MNIKEALTALGSEQESIANYLRVNNIKGYRCKSHMCPIATYLDRCGFKDVQIGGQVAWHGGGYARQWEPLSMALIQFIKSFDAGQYPELEE